MTKDLTGTKNKLTDLNDHLFSQLERLGEENLSGEKLNDELRRSKGMSGIAKDIISNAQLVLDAAVAKSEYQIKSNLPILEKKGSD